MGGSTVIYGTSSPYGFCLKLIVLLFLMQMVSWCYNRTFIASYSYRISKYYVGIRNEILCLS